MERSKTIVASRCAKVVAGAGSGTFFGRGDAFLEVAHFGRERGLVADGAGCAAQQGRHFRAGLGKAENVVNEQQHVLVLFVAEVFGDREGGESNAETGAGRLVHLAVHQTDAGAGFQNRQSVRPSLQMAFFVFLANDDVGLGHFIIEIVALAGALADPGEHRDAAVQLGNVIDQFHDNDGLADACAAESADFAAL